MSRARLLLSAAAAGVLLWGLVLLLRKSPPPPAPVRQDSLLALRDRPVAPPRRPSLHRSTADQAVPTAMELAQGNPTPGVTGHLERRNPTADAWDSEAVTEVFASQLDRIKAWVESNGGEPFPDEMSTEPFEATPLRPTTLRPVLHGPLFEVTRPAGPLPDEPRPTTLAEALGEFTSGGDNRRIKFKIAGIENTQDGWRTRLLVEFLHNEGGGRQQRSARWDCTWSEDRLRRIINLSYEEVRLSSKRSLFEDVTASAMSSVPSYEEQLLRGIDHFTARLTKLDEMTLYGHHGLALGDVNGDGLDDIYVCDGGGLPNRLYLQNPDGTLSDHSVASRTNWLESSSGALLVDLDNDGDQDLVVATVPLLLIAENDGTGVFTLRGGHEAVSDALSLTACDYDLDGDLDLYLCGYSNPGQANRFGYRGLESATPIPYHDARNGGRNALLQNRGDLQFGDVTDQAGLNQNNTRFSFAASWEDYDDDGDPDLYVANDFGRNNLYRNDGGRFRDVAAAAGVEDMAAGMSATWGDPNRDGKMDLYVGNMFSAAGNRVAYQRHFTTSRDEASTRGLQRMARGNTLFLNAGDGPFKDQSIPAGVNMGRWSWGSRFADLNNDGWPDLVVANGFFTGSKPDDL